MYVSKCATWTENFDAHFMANLTCKISTTEVTYSSHVWDSVKRLEAILIVTVAI